MPQITWLKLGITLAILLAAFGVGFELRTLMDHSNERAQLKAQAEATAVAQAKADGAAKDWEDQIAKLRVANGKLVRRLKNETSKAIYSTCIVPPDGVQLYNDATTGQSTGRPDGAMLEP